MFSSAQSLNRVQLFVTPWTTACQASLSITNSRGLPKFMSIELVMPSKHLILCRPLLLLPSIFHSIRVFSNESALRIRWQKYWSFSFNISLSNEHLGRICFRMDWLDLLAVQGMLKSLLQHDSSKEMAGWHHWLDGCDSEWTPGVGDGQGGLACCDSRSHKESDTTEWLNWTELKLWVACIFLNECFNFFFFPPKYILMRGNAV